MIQLISSFSFAKIDRIGDQYRERNQEYEGRTGRNTRKKDKHGKGGEREGGGDNKYPSKTEIQSVFQ